MGNLLPLIAIAGPTATGKTETAFYLAEKIEGEVVSCDSMQIYEGLEIGTAKPSKELMSKIPHHLIGLMPHNRIFNAYEYANLAAEKISEIRSRGKNPVIVGGTGFYLKALFEGMAEGVGRNENIRKELYRKIEEEGLESLYEELKRKDAEYAEKISLNDKKRIVRAMEVINGFNIKFSDLLKSKKKFVNEKYVIFCLFMDRDILYDRINRRVDLMIKNGLLEEAYGLFKENLDKNATVVQAIGYKELFDYFKGKTSLNDAVNLIKKRTRNYAKRQFTWFKKMKNVVWIDAMKDNDEWKINFILNYINKGK